MRISVVIPVHNGEAFLAQTIRSVLNQTLPAHEILVVDDGSNDRSADIAERFGPPMQVIHGRFGSAPAARLAGLERATGEALMFLDADDLLGPTVLEALSSVLAEHPGAIACCPWMRFERVDGCWLATPASCEPRRPYQDDLAAWLTGWYHPPCSVLWSRTAYEASGGWDPEVAVNNDGDLMMRALLAGASLVPTPAGTAYYRRLPEGGVSLSGRRFTEWGIESRLKVLHRVARRLEQAGRQARYRAALAEAYAIVAEDAAALPELSARALAASKGYGGLSSRRRLFLRSVARRLGDRAKPAASAVARSPAPDVPEASGEEPPLVSIVLPTFNRGPLLARALCSVLAQSYGNFEVLVVDDGSSEDIAGLLADFADPRLKHLRQSENRGVAAARNRGLADAAGSLIAFLDSDDEWLPEKLARQVALMRRRPGSVGLVYTGVAELGAEGRRTVTIPAERGDVWAEMLHRNVVHYGTSSTMIRREVVETVGFFDEALPAIEDYDYWTRIARFYEFDIVPEPLILYHNEPPAAGEAEEKRSRDFAANTRARRMFVDRYGRDALHAGALHRFHLDSARRQLEAPAGRAALASWLLVKAMRRCPSEPRLYLWLAFSLLPRRLRRTLGPRLQAARTRLPKRLWFGPGAA